MRRMNREVGVFNVSAIDLFASAMGAFILITLILFPFFPNTNQETDPPIPPEQGASQAFEEQIARMQSMTEALVAENADLAQRLQSANEQSSRRTGLLGIETEARSFVLVVDMSGSMNINGNDFREVVKQTVSRILVGLDDDDHQLAMIGFQGDDDNEVVLSRWPTQGGLVQLSQSTKADANRYVRQWMEQVNGGTPTRDALSEAIKLNPDAIIVLTDGAPTIPNDDWESVLRSVTTLNQRSEIHVVALGPFWEDADFVKFLTDLTTRNRGDLVAGTLRAP